MFFFRVFLLYSFYDQENVSTHLTNFIQFLQADGTIESRKTLVALYYNSGMIEEATEMLLTIPVDISDNSSFVDYYQLLLELFNQGKNIFQMDSQQESKVRTIAAGISSSAVSAQGILNLVYDERVDYNPVLTEVNVDYQVGGIEDNSLDENSNDYSLIVHPNPIFKSAVANFMISYSITPSFENASLKGVNQFGEIIASADLNDASGQINISCSDIPAGLYVIQLLVNGQVVSYKLINLLD